MKKRALSIVLTLALCLGMLPATAWAKQDPDPAPASQEVTTQAAPAEQDVALEEQDTEKQDAEEQDIEEQDGEEQVPETTPPTYSGGSGTERNPWLISTADDLKTLADTVNNGEPYTYTGEYFLQTNDIDLSNVVWEPIGYTDSDYYFSGHYDGGDYIISNAVSTGKLDEDGQATAGIFGCVMDGSVSNLHVRNADFTASGDESYGPAGGVTGIAYGATIENCTVENSRVESERMPDDSTCAGGIAGYAIGATFSNCASISNQIVSTAYAGGFVGEIDDDEDYGVEGFTTYTNCYVSNGTVTATTDSTQGSSFAGGFAGMVTYDKLIVTNCYVYNTTLSTEGTSGNIVSTGALAGYLHNGSTISATNCYYGACNATEDADGVTAQTEGQFKDGTVAGLLGENFAQGKDGYPVFAVHAAGIELDQSSLTISVGNSKTLTATLTPANATDTVTWTSSEEDIATVENGVVTAKAVGETTITATAGDVTDVCTVEVIECGHTDGTNNDGQCRTCGYQFAFKATDADGNLKGFYDKIYDAFVQMPISGGTVTVLKDADGETQYSPNVTKTFVVDIQDHKLSCNDVHGFSPRARVTITGGKDSQIDTVTADQYVNVTLASTFQGTITTLNATDGNLTVQPGCTAHVKKLQSTYNSTKRIQLMGGSYDKIDINASGLKLGNLLETGYRFESTDDSGRDLCYSDSLYYKGTNLKVVPCTSHSYENGFCKYCNEECPHTTVENNQCTICGLAMVATVTADGETAYYSALQTALNAAADGAVVKPLEDVTADAVTISSPITLDLNGKVIRADLTVTNAGAKLTDSVGNGGIKKLTVAEGMTVASLLEEGFLFKNSSGRWVTDLTVTELNYSSIAPIPIRLGTMKDSYDVVYRAEDKNIIALEVFAPESGEGFGEYDLFLELRIKSSDGTTVLGSGSTSGVTLDPDNKRAVFSLDGFLTSWDAGTYQCTIESVRYRPSQTDAYTLTGQTFTVNVLQSGTEAAVETGISDSYFDQKDTFTYGERITVRAMFDPTGERPAATFSMTPPTEDQCAVFNEKGEQISEAKTVESSTWLDVLTTDLGVGTHNLTVRYLGGNNQEGATVPFTVTVNPCEITELALDETQLAYTGAAQTKGVAAVTAGRLTLTADDYDVRGNVQTEVGSYKLTVTGKGNYTGTLTGEYTIAKAAAPEAEHGTMTVSNNHAATYEMEIPALPALDAGTYGAVSYALGEVDLSQGYYDKETGAKVADGKLFLPINANPVETTGSIGTVTIKVTTDNYEDFFLTIDVSATNKIVPIGEPTLSTTTITYGDKLSKVTLSGGLKDGDSAVLGVFSWEELDAVLTAGEHQVTWRFVPTDGRTYAETTGAVTITVNKAAPTGAPKYTAITASGKTLEDAGLTAEGGTFSVPGQVQWVDADGDEMDVSTEVKANTAYSWKFVPEDEENYESLTGSITLYAVSHSGGGGGGGSSSGSSGSAAKTDDVTTTVKTDENGNTQTDVKVSDKALSDAKKSGEAVKIPTGVKAGEDSNSAPVVKIDLPKNAGETKIEVPVDNVTPGTVAVIVHEDGTEEILSSSKPTEDGLEFTIDGSATIKVIDNSKTFVDTGDHWAKGAIDYISARDLVSGVGDKLFAPDLTATRAQLWTILARMNGETVTGGQTWYELPQLWAKKNGVSDGTDPNGTITRAQLVTMLWRTAGSPTAGSETKFTDVPADSYYAQAVAWAAANGITTGVGSGRFDPEAPCTRAQLATFLYQNMK